MKYREYIKLFENKDRFFDKNEVLEDNDKEFYKKFFKEHPEQEGKIKNWNFKLTKEDFDKVVYGYDNNFDKLPNETLDDLAEGVDYDYLGEIYDYKVYFIYTHKASYTIASNNVGLPIWSPLPSWYMKDNAKDDYVYNRADNTYSGAKWCTAMHHDDFYFKKYFKDNHVCFLYCCAKNKADLPIGTEKLAIALNYRTLQIFQIYDAWDEYFNEGLNSTFQEFIDDNNDKIKNCISKLFDYFKKYYGINESAINKEDVSIIIEEELMRISNNGYIPDSVQALLRDSNIDIIEMLTNEVNAGRIAIDTSDSEAFRDKISTLLRKAIRYLNSAYFNTQDKRSVLLDIFGDNNKDSRNQSFIVQDFTSKKNYYFGGERYYSNSLLDMYSCIMYYLKRQYNTLLSSSTNNAEIADKEFLNKLEILFYDIDSFADELTTYVNTYKDNLKDFFKAKGMEEVFAFQNLSAIDTMQSELQSENSFENSSSILVKILVKLIDASGIFDAKSGIYMFGDNISISTSASDSADRLHGFFAGLAMILLKYINITHDSAYDWFNAFYASSEDAIYSSMFEVSTSPTVALIYDCGGYYFNRCMLDCFAGTSTFELYGRY